MFQIKMKFRKILNTYKLPIPSISIALLLLFSIQSVIGIKSIQAHNFDTDDNSTFLTLINQILIETRLINNSLSSDDLDRANAIESVKNIIDIYDDITISEDSYVVDSDKFYNNTIMATVIANLADEVLRNYGAAFSVPSNIMLSMDFSKIVNYTNIDSKGQNLSHSANHPVGAMTELKFDGEADYYNAKEISDRIVEIYDSDLKGHEIGNVSSNITPSALEKSLYELQREVTNVASPMKIMEIVHAKVHPNLQLAFNLTLKR